MSDKMREEFEAAMLNALEVDLKPFRKVDDTGFDAYCLDGCFTSVRSQIATCAWMMWQASHESLVVELPNIADYLDLHEQENSARSFMDALTLAIESLGLRVKP